MGKIFDGLEMLIDRNGGKDWAEYARVLHKATSESVITLDLIVPQLRNMLNMSESEFFEMTSSYLKRSRESGKALLTPYEITAIEDRQGVVIIDRVEKDSFTLISYVDTLDSPVNGIYLFRAEIGQGYNDGKIAVMVYPGFAAFVDKRTMKAGVNIIDDPGLGMLIKKDMATSAIATVDELAYIMDPVHRVVTDSETVQKADMMRKSMERDYMKAYNSVKILLNTNMS